MIVILGDAELLDVQYVFFHLRKCFPCTPLMSPLDVRLCECIATFSVLGMCDERDMSPVE